MKIFRLYKISLCFFIGILMMSSLLLTACKKQNNQGEKDEILTSSSLVIDYEKNTIYGETDNDIESYNLNNKLTVIDGYSWSLYLDLEGLINIPTNTFILNVGNNVKYVLLSNNNDSNDKKLYTLTIRRLPIYTVTFDTLGGSTIENLYIQENDSIYKSTFSNCEKTGYAFTGWDCENEVKITQDTTITALYTANKYKVYYDESDRTKFVYATYGEYCTLPIPEKPSHLSELYSFKGYTDNNNISYFNRNGQYWYNSPDAKPMKFYLLTDLYVKAVWGRG